MSKILEARNAENSAGYVLAKIHSIKEQSPNLAILDVGCGPGTISISLAKVIPDGHVIGIDIAPHHLTRARTLAQKAEIKNIEFQEGDATKLPFPDGTFDVTMCHQTLTWLKNPWDALREMIRVTKPGGIIAAREGDQATECIFPELPGLLKYHKLTSTMLKHAGGADKGGRQLLSWALKAGVERKQITMNYGTWCYSTREEKELWTEVQKSSWLRDTAIKLGWTAEDNDEMAAHWKEWVEREDASVAMMHGEIIIQK